MEGASIIPVPPEHLHSGSSQIDPRQVPGSRNDQWSGQSAHSYERRRHDSIIAADDYGRRQSSIAAMPGSYSDTRPLSQVQTTYESYSLRKAPLEKKGDRPTWAKARMSLQPLDPAELADRIKKSNMDVGREHAKLADSQQQVIQNVISRRMDRELNPYAEWVLAYVKPDVVRDLFGKTIETRSIQIILKRQDVHNPQLDSDERRKSRQKENIIDINDSRQSLREGSTWRDGMFRDVQYGDPYYGERPSLRDGRAYSQQILPGSRMSVHERGSFPESAWQRSQSGGAIQSFQDDRGPDMVEYVDPNNQPTRKKSKKNKKNKDAGGQGNMEENFTRMNLDGHGVDQQVYADANDPLATAVYDYVPNMQQQPQEQQMSNTYQQQHHGTAARIPVQQYHQQQAQQKPAAPDAPQYDPTMNQFRVPGAWQSNQWDNLPRQSQQGVMDQYLNGQNDPFASVSTSAFPQQQYESARRSSASHPFTPLSGVGYPSLYNHDLMLNDPPLQEVDEGVADFDRKSRSRSNSKRHSSSEKKNLKRIEGKLDDLRERLDQTYATAGSSDGTGDGASMFSDPVFPHPFTPETTPPRSPTVNRGSLHGFGRKGSVSSRDGRYTTGYRGKYGDEVVEIEPGNSYRGRPRMSQRNSAQDDYPRSAGADGRSVAYPQIQRRMTISAADMDRADTDDLRRREREIASYIRNKQRARDADPALLEAYDLGRRHERSDGPGRGAYYR